MNDGNGNKGLNIDENGNVCLYGLDKDDIPHYHSTIKELLKHLTRLKNMSQKKWDELTEG